MITCNNCGKKGHIGNHCQYPITSYGIIVYTFIKNIPHYLMIRRIHSFGYIDFIRGKYSMSNLRHIQSLIDEMSVTEKENILTYPFFQLVKQLWNSSYLFNKAETSPPSDHIVTPAELKFNAIPKQTLVKMISGSSTSWVETDWEFPKGRKNMKEKDIECASREFNEETEISAMHFYIINNIHPFEETFIGTNHKPYKNKYYLAYMPETYATTIYSNQTLCNYSNDEVSKIEWKTYDECIKSARTYHFERKNMIRIINSIPITNMYFI